MKLGARIFKTGIAIILSLFLSELFQLPSPLFAAIAAIFAIQPTVYRSFLSIVEQIQGNAIGAIIAVVFVLLLGKDMLIVGLAAIILITINLKLKIENTIGLSLVTMLVIMETPGDAFIEFAFIRFLTIMLGVLSAFIVNLFFLPPKYEKKLYYQLSDVTVEITKWIRMTIRHSSEHKPLKNDIKKMKETVRGLDQLYSLFKEERHYLKRDTFAKSRKLVVYRQMISTVKRALEVLRKLHRYENDLYEMPAEFQVIVQQQLDSLVHYHEHVMLKFIGKVRPQMIFEDGEFYLKRKELANQFLSYQKNSHITDESTLTHTMQIVSAIIDYDEQIEHLDKIISSFQRYHKKTNKILIEK